MDTITIIMIKFEMNMKIYYMYKQIRLDFCV